MMKPKPYRPPLLHDHLDGSGLLLPMLPELFRMNGKNFPFSPSPEKYGQEVRVIFPKPGHRYRGEVFGTRLA